MGSLQLSKLHVNEINAKDSANTAMTIDSGGKVLFPNTPRFHARLSANQSIPDSADTLLQLNTVDYNVGSYYDTSTYRFTPPAGVYCITFMVTINSSTPDYVLGRIFKNGSNGILDHRGMESNAANAYVSCNGTVQAYLNGTDYIDFRVQHNVNSAADASSTVGQTFACGFLIG